MEGNTRRKKLIALLQNSRKPLSGAELSKHLGVSRQVIVQDIALLRAVNKNILSTTKGYLLYYPEIQKVNRCFHVCHTTGQISDELNTIVDCGGKVLNVIVSHEIYGEISADLIITNRQDAADFVQKVTEKKTIPLKELTDSFHYHTVEADNEAVLDLIEKRLAEKGYLVRSPS